MLSILDAAYISTLIIVLWWTRKSPYLATGMVFLLLHASQVVCIKLADGWHSEIYLLDAFFDAITMIAMYAAQNRRSILIGYLSFCKLIFNVLWFAMVKITDKNDRWALHDTFVITLEYFQIAVIFGLPRLNQIHHSIAKKVPLSWLLKRDSLCRQSIG